MIPITTVGFWAACALACVAIAFLGGWHHWHLDERQRELKIHTDSQIKYFSMIVHLFGCISWLILAVICCGMMVYMDLQSQGL